jgi:multiple sugar transport system substrate-binding protein
VTRASEGCAFLVARGRRAGYRIVLAPAFLIDENEHHVLAESTGAGGHDGDGPRVVELVNAQVGPVSIGYTSERVACADVEPGADAGLLATDEHGRPLEIVYGVVSRDRLDGPLDAEDLQTARTHALRSYRSFLADEQGHSVDASVPFVLRTRGRARSVSSPAPAASHEPALAARAQTGGRWRWPGGRGVPAIAAAIGVALVAAGSLIVSSGGQETSAVSPAWLADPPAGRVRFCASEDVSRSQARSTSDYNRMFSGSNAVLVPLSAGAHELPTACDVISLDVVYTAGFAARHLLYDLTPYLTADRRAAFDDRIMRTAGYDGRLWGVPEQLDVGVLYYRADRVRRAPRSWPDLFRQARRRSPGEPPRLRLPLASPEGLTVVFLELAYAAAARPIVTNDGKTADIDQPAMLAALRSLRAAVRDGATPRVAATDIGALYAYESGRASFLRGWPFVAARMREDARKAPALRVAADRTRIVPLPPWHVGGRRVGVLGGRNLVIPRGAHNPSAALRLIDFLTSPAQVRKDAREASQIPVLKAVARDPDVRNGALLKAVNETTVVSRPSIPRYAQVSRIISSGIGSVLRRPAEPALVADTLRAIDRDVQRVLDRGSS